jgi:tRNA-splicing endonuclease subunit Sen34
MHHLQAYNAARIELAQRHLALGEVKEAKAAAEVDWAMSETAIQKRKDRERKRQADAALKAATEGDPRDGGSLFEPTPEAVPKPSEGRSGNPAPVLSNKRTYTITTPSSSNSLGWYNTDGHVYATIAAAKAAGIWSFPASLHERALCGVFRGLWEQGFFMGGGIKFGGDYLVYPGPSR